MRKECFELSGGKGVATEEITTIAHGGTHVDAPWYHAPTSEGVANGEPARTERPGADPAGGTPGLPYRLEYLAKPAVTAQSHHIDAR